MLPICTKNEKGVQTMVDGFPPLLNKHTQRLPKLGDQSGNMYSIKWSGRKAPKILQQFNSLLLDPHFKNYTLDAILDLELSCMKDALLFIQKLKITNK